MEVTVIGLFIFLAYSIPHSTFIYLSVTNYPIDAKRMEANGQLQTYAVSGAVCILLDILFLLFLLFEYPTYVLFSF